MRFEACALYDVIFLSAHGAAATLRISPFRFGKRRARNIGGNVAGSVAFTQEDPIGVAGGVNLYGYGEGDPVNNSDPFGLCPDDPRRPCPAWTGSKAMAVFQGLSTLKRAVTPQPSVTITAGPVSAQFGSSGASITASTDVGFALTLDGTFGTGAGDVGTVGVGGVAGFGMVGGGTLNLSEHGVQGITYSIGIGGKLPVGKALSLSRRTQELLRAAGLVNSGLGDDSKPPR